MTPVPRLRPELVIRGGARTTIDDPRAGKRYALEGPLHAAIAAIDGTRDVDALFEIGARAATALTRLELEQAITALDRLSLLEPRDAGARPLRFALGLNFGCVACGESCRRFRVGPLTPEDQAHIRSHDWRANGYPEVPTDPFVTAPDGVYLKKRTDGACVFLGADNLCNVHRVLGAEKKPLVCRLFPFEWLEDAEGVRVLFRLECASLPLAISPGGPSAATEREARDLLSRRTHAPVGFPSTPFLARSPLQPLPLAPGRTYSIKEHDAIRERALAVIADRSRGPLVERLAAVTRGVVRATLPGEGKPLPEPLQPQALSGAPAASPVAAFEEGLASPPRSGGAPDRELALSLTASLRVGLRGARVIEPWDPDRPAPAPIAPEAQKRSQDLPFETQRSRVRIAALLDALLEVLPTAPDDGGATLGPALAASLEARAGSRTPLLLPERGQAAFRNPGAREDFDAEDALAYALSYSLLREKTILSAGDLLFGYGLLALRFAAARALAALFASLRGRPGAPSAYDANDAAIDVDAVLRLTHTPELAAPLARFLETETFRLFA